MFKGIFLIITFAVVGTTARAEVTRHFDPVQTSGWLNHFATSGLQATNVTYHPAPAGCGCDVHCVTLATPTRPDVWPRPYSKGIEVAHNSGGSITAEMIEGIPVHSGHPVGSDEGGIHPAKQVCALLID